MKILKIEVGKEPYEKEVGILLCKTTSLPLFVGFFIENSLKALQSEVEGLIELIYLDNDSLIVINEEGKINSSVLLLKQKRLRRRTSFRYFMMPNRWIGDDIICGPFFICGDEGEDFGSLSDEKIQKYKEYFSEIPEFSMKEKALEPRVEVISFDPKDMKWM